MHIVIMGCGRVGSALADMLEKQGHSLSVIDRRASSFRRLGPHFAGQTITGVGFDRDTLRRAGIEKCHAFAAVSSGDNSNILAARVARETFGVERVVARIYDPKRAEIYERLGIPTVATVAWSTGQTLRRLLPEGASEEWRDPSGQIVLSQVTCHEGWIGRPVDEIVAATGTRLALITRYGQGLLPESDMVYQEGDLLHLVMPAERHREIDSIVEEPPAEAEQ